MGITLVGVVLFLHVAVAVVTFGIASILLTGMVQMRSAREMSVLRSWAGVNGRIEPAFPVLVLILIGLGAWLIHLSQGEFRWSDGWVVTSIVALIVMEAYGGIVLAPAGKRLHSLVAAQQDGPVPPQIRVAVLSRAVWAGAFGNTGTALGILFLMPTKPAAPAAVVIVIAATLVATAIGLGLVRAAPAQVGPAIALEQRAN
jgi:hypothetical protein